MNQRHVADEAQGRWPLAISSFAQVLSLVEGGPRPARPSGPARVARRRGGR